MNRRDILVGSAQSTAIAVLATMGLPSGVMAKSMPPLVSGKNIFWTPDARTNEFAALVSEWISDCLERGMIRTIGDLSIERKTVKLIAPYFYIETTENVPSAVYRSHVDRRGLRIKVASQGCEVFETHVTTALYRDSNGDYVRPKSIDHVPDFFVKSVYMPYEDEIKIKTALPMCEIEIDVDFLNAVFNSNV